MGPNAVKAITYKPDLYKGTPTDFSTNMLYILNQRQRENSIYAFVWLKLMFLLIKLTLYNII